ncbi:flagellar hook-associated protein FlgK [Plesiomonas shigelloides]|uniref:flagellar hook-associated protein FlgK n=1 Tax=Plesiomonas shigelloides TaxID=703 RepID=UPI0012614A8D|nr:flagellar hook-associated protein FlgK [Plesiomonas shigelloides]KAB7701678.1 flagellar hook-associated protein FlgK [Plesiomonas shigelloides]
MNDLLQLGMSGVLANQAQLRVTGNNINNVNTIGYSRQVAVQTTNGTQYQGNLQFGTGVNITEVRRVYSTYANNELNMATTKFSNATQRTTGLTELDNLLSKVGIKIPNTLNSWFDAVNKLGDAPNDVALRQQVLEQGKNLSAQFNNLHSTLDNKVNELNDQLTGSAQRVNDIAKELADLNKTIVEQGGSSNEMEDRRQALLDELAEYTQVSTVPKDDGSMNVLIGGGHTLVSGGDSAKIKMVDGSPDPRQSQMAISWGNSSKPLNGQSLGGKLGAMFEMRDVHIPKAMDQIGLMAIGIADAINKQQQQGLDLNGDIGQNMFTDINSDQAKQSRAISNNPGLDLGVNIDDVSKLSAGPFQVEFDGKDYILRDKSGNELEKLTPKGTPMNGLSSDKYGFTLEINGGTIAKGDKIEIRPTRQGAADIGMNMTDPSQIAAQGITNKGEANKGSGSVNVSVKDKADPNYPIDGRKLNIEYFDDGGKLSYRITDGGEPPKELQKGEYTAGAKVNVGGMEITLGGKPQVGDSFSIDMEPASGSNTNLLAMQDLQNSKIMGNGTQTLFDVYEKLNTDIGAAQSSAMRDYSHTKLEYQSAATRASSVSGVDLNEEAGNLIRYQQSYSASARIITLADDIFKTLMGALG